MCAFKPKQVFNNSAKWKIVGADKNVSVLVGLVCKVASQVHASFSAWVTEMCLKQNHIVPILPPFLPNFFHILNSSSGFALCLTKQRALHSLLSTQGHQVWCSRSCIAEASASQNDQVIPAHIKTHFSLLHKDIQRTGRSPATNWVQASSSFLWILENL